MVVVDSLRDAETSGNTLENALEKVAERLRSLNTVTVDAVMLADVIRALDLDPYAMPSTQRAGLRLAMAGIAWEREQ